MSWEGTRRRVARALDPSCWERTLSANTLIFLLWAAVMGFAALFLTGLALIGSDLSGFRQALYGAGGSVTIGFFVWAIVKKAQTVKVVISWVYKEAEKSKSDW